MKAFNIGKICRLFFAATILYNCLLAESNQAIIGGIRIQALSENLIRIEQKGPNGFEDRKTFTVVDRTWPGTPIEISIEDDRTILTTARCMIEVPNNSQSLDNILIKLKEQKTQYVLKGIPVRTYIPGPVERDQLWLIADFPRLIPSEWGATPPQGKFKDHPSSGWDTTNSAQDVYIFILQKGKYDTFKNNFLKLTGHTPMPPLYAFGLWNSRYYEYSEESALKTIETYRSKQIPLDVFVVDTDWRLGASHGYAVNDVLFPDMKRFINKAHLKNVRLMFNDHPEAQTGSALDPAEIQYRWDGLTSLLEKGIDIWWYDRNWATGLLEPMPGISKEVWGMCMYHDITKRFHPDRRPLIMSNVDGIDNGFWNAPSHPASHRFPVWWTGDQKSRWEYLEMGISNGVNSGIHRMMPYVNEDLGGHTPDNPEPEQYIRWVQFGVFSPITRLHCTRGLTRYPWNFGEEAERITSEYIRLRYRLLPTIYAAARRAYEDGTPILRRCDLEWPNEPEAKRDRQFFFGEDLLVAPYAVAKTKDIVLSADFFRTSGGKSGLTGEYYDNQELKGNPALVRIDSVLDFIWGTASPDTRIPIDHFSVRWTGFIQVPGNAKNLKLKLISDDGVRLWINDSLIIDAWHDQAATDYPIMTDLQPGRSYAIKIEFFENMGGAHFQAIQTVDVEQLFKIWIPPGEWQDLWTGEILRGPKIETLNPELWKCPLYIRDGGIIFSLPQIQYTSEHPWNTIIIDAFVPKQQKTSLTRILYEDDGFSPEYHEGAFCKTAVKISRTNSKIQLLIDKKEGKYSGSLESRNWIVRLNLPAKSKPYNIQIDGRKPGLFSKYGIKLISETEQKAEVMPFLGTGGKPRRASGLIIELNIPERNVQKPISITFDMIQN